MSWARKVEALNAREFSWERVAAGFTTREKVAEDLGCAPENVRSKLSAGLRLGHFEAKTFKVWDAQRKQLVMKEGYRVVEKKDEVRRVKDEGKGGRPVQGRKQIGVLLPPDEAVVALTPGAQVHTRKRGNAGKILKVEKDRVMIRYGTREVWTKIEAFRRGDVSLVG